MWPVTRSAQVTMTERGKKERTRKRSFFFERKKKLLAMQFNICEISEVKIFLEFSHLQGERKTKGERGRDSEQQVPSSGLDSSYYTQLLLENYTICNFG